MVETESQTWDLHESEDQLYKRKTQSIFFFLTACEAQFPNQKLNLCHGSEYASSTGPPGTPKSKFLCEMFSAAFIRGKLRQIALTSKYENAVLFKPVKFTSTKMAAQSISEYFLNA